MDVVTHALMGIVIASPLASAAPLSAGCLALGSVLPDVDALSRILGKRAFLRWHQTCTHSLAGMAATSLAGCALLSGAGGAGVWAGLALGAGMLVHIGMDLTNTYGVALLTPFSPRRHCLDWIFFIDAVTIAASAATALISLKMLTAAGAKGVPPHLAIGYAVFLAAYWAARFWLRQRAWRRRPAGASSLVPTALVPGVYFGYGWAEGQAYLFEMDAFTGRTRHESRQETVDSRYAPWLTQVAEYRLMRELFSGYHAVAASRGNDETVVVCRDLCRRNFGGAFGRLGLTFTAAGQLRKMCFHV